MTSPMSAITARSVMGDRKSVDGPAVPSARLCDGPAIGCGPASAVLSVRSDCEVGPVDCSEIPDRGAACESTCCGSVFSDAIAGPDAKAVGRESTMMGLLITIGALEATGPDFGAATGDEGTSGTCSIGSARRMTSSMAFGTVA